MAEHHEDVELGDMEDEAFLPNQNGMRKGGKESVFIQWLPKPIRGFVKNLSRMKVSKPQCRDLDFRLYLTNHVTYSSCS
jgi:hypothetical protein